MIGKARQKVLVLAPVLAASLIIAGCRTADLTDYRAKPVLAEQDWGDRLHASVEGVRVIAGPASVFPYERKGPDGERVWGQYQLFTRVMVHNSGSLPAEVVWSGAVLELPDGGRIGLVETRRVAARGTGGGEAGAGDAPDLVERLEPGHRTSRALIPATVTGIEAGEPMVPLCDGCEYRLVVPVRIGGRERRIVLPYRLEVARPRSSGAGPF